MPRSRNLFFRYLKSEFPKTFCSQLTTKSLNFTSTKSVYQTIDILYVHYQDINWLNKGISRHAQHCVHHSASLSEALYYLMTNCCTEHPPPCYTVWLLHSFWVVHSELCFQSDRAIGVMEFTLGLLCRTANFATARLFHSMTSSSQQMSSISEHELQIIQLASLYIWRKKSKC